MLKEYAFFAMENEIDEVKRFLNKHKKEVNSVDELTQWDKMILGIIPLNVRLFAVKFYGTEREFNKLTRRYNATRIF